MSQQQPACGQGTYSMYRVWQNLNDMSSTPRHTATRRLPPIQKSATISTQKQTTKMVSAIATPTSSKDNYGHVVEQDMVITGRNITSTPPSSSNSSSPNHLRPDGSLLSCANTLNPDVIRAYLAENPECLERYLLSEVSVTELERILDRRRAQLRNTNARPVSNCNNGELISRNKRDSSPRWMLTRQRSQETLLRELTMGIHKHQSKAQVLSELSASLATAINADGFNLYLVENKEILFYRIHSDKGRDSCDSCEKVADSHTLPAYVAELKQPVRLAYLHTSPSVDDRFPDGLCPGNSTSIEHVLSQPIMHYVGDVMGVVELYRNVGGSPFTEEDEEYVRSIAIWGTLSVHYAQMYHCMTEQRDLNEFLLAVTKSIFQDIVSIDTVIMKIMNYVKRLVNADRTALFLVDSRTKELYARVFDMGEESEASKMSPQTQKEIRFSMEKGIAGHVASTGDVLNIKNAYDDKRFNRDVDTQTGYTTKSVLCMPIYIRGSIIGVVQMVNKIGGVFTQSDEQSFEMFAVYCGLALHHAKLYEKIRRSEQKYKVALEVLSYHSQATEEEFQQLNNMEIPKCITDLMHYDFSPWSVSYDEKPLYVIYMFKEIFNFTRYDLQNLHRFTLTVRKNYRNVPYHNWDHAFSVAHAMYTILKTTKHKFTHLETLSLFVACLCHDLDHRGKTNAFLSKNASPLAAIYSTSTMEHHHFNQTITILQHEGHNIFKHLSSEEYKQVLGHIKQCILATDLAIFFGNVARLKEHVDTGNFDWTNMDHRMMLMANSMTASDLCSMYKPWDLQKQLVEVIMEEFWLQGDQEKLHGNTPIPMMDRDKADQLAQSQVGFLVGICLPCYELQSQILPDSRPMVDGAKANLATWQKLAACQKEKSETGDKLEENANVKRKNRAS